jgi:hypothetical protein
MRTLLVFAGLFMVMAAVGHAQYPCPTCPPGYAPPAVYSAPSPSWGGYGYAPQGYGYAPQTYAAPGGYSLVPPYSGGCSGSYLTQGYNFGNSYSYGNGYSYGRPGFGGYAPQGYPPQTYAQSYGAPQAYAAGGY